MHDAIILSDLHLGAPNCQHRQLGRFLKQIVDGEQATRQLILNGDVFDSIDFRRLPSSHWDILATLRELNEEIPVRWIVGNHDSPRKFLSTLLGNDLLDEYVLQSGGRRLLVLHGHQFDAFLEKHAFLTHAADWGYRLLQMVDPSHRVARFAKQTSKTFLRCTDKVRDEAVALAIHRNMDGVVCGHTHRAMTEENNDFGYYNSGCWTELPCTYLTVKAGQVTLECFTENVRTAPLELPPAPLRNGFEEERATTMAVA